MSGSNVEPQIGEPARFGFYVVMANLPVLVNTVERNGVDESGHVSGANVGRMAAFR